MTTIAETSAPRAATHLERNTLERKTLDQKTNGTTPAGRDQATNRQRLALAVLLGATAVLYLWNLSASGWANAFYSAAAQAGADNWTAFLFGSSDMANSITVDKPPAAIWVMALSVKLFGLNSWSLLVPQALMGVGSVGLLYLSVRRWYGSNAGLLAGAALALTPIAALIFRFNNPDALLVLLLIAAAYAMVRATEAAAVRWLMLAAALIGFAFLTKSLQALLVLPAFALTYLIAAPTTIGRRIRDLLIAAAVMVLAGGWWVAVVELWPADSRPYIGGSQTNSAWELILGYNGLGRITGDEPGSVVPGGTGAGGGMWGDPSWHRMFDASWAGGIAWLLPAALLLMTAGFWLTRRDSRTDRYRAGLILWSGWLLVTALTFSFASGIIHEYYAVALAPAIAAVVAIGATLLWRRRAGGQARWALAVVVAVSALYATSLLIRADGAYSLAAFVVAVGGMAAAAGLGLAEGDRWQRMTAGAAVVLLLAGPLLFTLDTVATPHTGSLPSAGPALSGSGVAGRGGPPAGGPGGIGGPTGGPGGLLNASTPSSELVATLTQDAGDYTWIAAAVGSQSGAGYQLATGYSVMPIGGFNGSDPSPTLAEFQDLVAQGRIHWFIASNGGPGGGRGGPGGGTSAAISQWVQQNFTAVTVDGVTLYDLTERA